MKKNQKQKKKLRDVVAQGQSQSHRIKNVDGYFFSQSNAYAQVNGPLKSQQVHVILLEQNSRRFLETTRGNSLSDELET